MENGKYVVNYSGCKILRITVGGRCVKRVRLATTHTQTNNQSVCLSLDNIISQKTLLRACLITSQTRMVGNKMKSYGPSNA